VIAFLPTFVLGLAFSLPQPKVGETTELGSVPGRVRLALTLVGAGSVEFARHPTVRPYLAHDPKLGSEKARGAVAADLRRRVMSRAPDWAKQGRLDLLLEASMHLRDTDREEFANVVRLMQGVVKPIAQKYLPAKMTAPPGEDTRFKTWDDQYLLKLHPLYLSVRAPRDHDYVPWLFDPSQRLRNETRKSFMMVRAERLVIDYDGCTRGVFLVRDGISSTPRPIVEQEWISSFVVCGGDVIAPELAHTNILIADGDVRLSSQVPSNDTSLVIATGNITADWSLCAVECCLIAGGDIRSGRQSRTPDSLLYAGGKVDLVKGPNSKFGKHTSGYDFAKTGLKFFTLTDVGLTLEKADDKVSVKAVGARSLFRDAMQSGDQLLEVNHRKIDSVSEGKRALRAATVLEYAVVTVRRKDKELKYIVYLPDATPKK